MKIALLGYGKMGQMVENIALQKKHTIVAKVDQSTGFPIEELKTADVWIDFTHPSCALSHVMLATKLGKNLVMGTTGWYDQVDEIKEMVQAHQIGFLFSPNFSIGVQLFLKIVASAASLIDRFDQYDVGMFELHHRNKADSPSGTAKMIANMLIQHMTRKEEILPDTIQGPIPQEGLHVPSLRCGHVPGTHTVLFDSPADSITLTHQARNREGFATGAVTAAEWLQNKKGFFTLDDIL